jgi:hypothetical protein
MATRSPWRDLKIPIRFGSELPVLLRHDPAPRTLARQPWRPITNHPGDNKPHGGLWTAPAILPPGKWRPIPRRSEWTDWCETEGEPSWVNYGWQTQIHPDPTAPFAVISCAADAVALYEAFPWDDNPLAQLLKAAGVHGGIMDLLIDWAALLNSGVAGVYLTHWGMIETRLPDRDSGIPSLYTWDLPTVWFGRKAFRVGKTWPSPRIPVDPEDDLPPRELARRNRDRLRAMAAEAGPESGVEGAMALDTLEALFLEQFGEEDGPDDAPTAG